MTATISCMMRTRGATTELRRTSVCLCTHRCRGVRPPVKPDRPPAGHGHVGTARFLLCACVHARFWLCSVFRLSTQTYSIRHNYSKREGALSVFAVARRGTRRTQHIHIRSGSTRAQPIFPALASGCPGAVSHAHADAARGPSDASDTYALPCATRTAHQTHCTYATHGDSRAAPRNVRRL